MPNSAAGPEVTETYIDFFTSTIRNRNTRAAYARACWQFFEWCAAHSLVLTTVRPFHVAAWIEDFPESKPTIKLKLAAVRMLYDFLVVRQITRSNPAHSVRGPKYVVKKGKTPVWSREDAKTLLDSIPKDSVSGFTGPSAHCRDVLQLRPGERSTVDRHLALFGKPTLVHSKRGFRWIPDQLIGIAWPHDQALHACSI
jgi:hypothetical protein